MGSTSRACTTECQLVLTGQRLRRRHLVTLDGREIWLPTTLFATLCKLVHARCSTCTGFVSESPLVVYRLRDLLDTPEQRQVGQSLIETGDGQEYRLSLDCGYIHTEPSIEELPCPSLITVAEKLTLVGLCYTPPDEIRLKSV